MNVGTSVQIIDAKNGKIGLIPIYLRAFLPLGDDGRHRLAKIGPLLLKLIHASLAPTSIPDSSLLM